MRGDTYPFKVLQFGELNGTPEIMPCGQKYGCSPRKVTLCREQFVEDCPSAEESRKKWERINAKARKERAAQLRYKDAMFELKKVYLPLYRGLMRAIAWLLLLPFPERKDET